MKLLTRMQTAQHNIFLPGIRGESKRIAREKNTKQIDEVMQVLDVLSHSRTPDGGLGAYARLRASGYLDSLRKNIVKCSVDCNFHVKLKEGFFTKDPKLVDEIFPSTVRGLRQNSYSRCSIDCGASSLDISGKPCSVGLITKGDKVIVTYFTEPFRDYNGTDADPYKTPEELARVFVRLVRTEAITNASSKTAAAVRSG